MPRGFRTTNPASAFNATPIALVANGPTPAFRYRFASRSGGIPIYVATQAVAGNFDGATVRFEFRLAGIWHRTTVALRQNRRFWKIQESAAIIGTAYRFVVVGAGASTSLSIEVASPDELMME